VPGPEHRYDVIIIGGGLIGSSAAMHLAERGVKSIALLDVDLGGRYSSSELNAGGVRATFRSDLNIALSLASIEFYETVAEEVGFDQKGYLWLHDDEHWPEAEAALQLQNDKWKLGVQTLTPDQVAAHCPLLDQLDGVRAATFSPRDGLLNPNLL
jgi:sarcosine oxidase, subunit beta